ncbi:MAG: hypothetical protein JSS82_05775 [Bacteroidetes bacterium]|nr:hypothetical protein [Bacteroidota bacterium]
MKRKQLIPWIIAIVCLAFVADRSFAQGKRHEGDKIYYKGNVLDIVPEKSTSYQDNKIQAIEPGYKIIKLNGKKVYSYPDASQPLSSISNQLFVDLAAKLLDPEITSIEKKGYSLKIHNIVIDEEGGIVYYDYSGVYKAYPAMKGIIDKAEINAIDKKVERVMNGMHFKPARFNGRNVAYWIPLAIGAA